MASNIPITEGSGATSVAAEQIGTVKYQIIKVVGAEAGSTSTLGVNPDRSINVSVVGTVAMAGSVLAVPTGNQSVSGAVTAPAGSVMTIATLAGSIMSVSATAPAGSIMTIVHPAGSVTGVRTDNASVITIQPAGSILAVSGTTTTIAGSILSITHPAGSVTGVRTDNASVITVAIAGSVTGVRTDNASVITVWKDSSVISLQPAGSVLAVSGSFSPSGNQSISGTVNIGTGGPVSVLGTMSVLGTVPVTQATTPWSVTAPAGSVLTIATLAGSVVGVRTDNSSVITVPQFSSILAVPVGSIITVWQSPSIVGTYVEDAASASADKGVFTLNVRNDTMASVSSSDGDYTQLTVGPVGEAITANSPITKWVSGTASMLGGVPMTCSVTVIAAQGSSVFTYVTGIQVANMGSASVLVSFGAATSSLIGYTIAPAGGGSNINFPNGLKTNANAAFSASISGTASIYVSAQGFISKT